MLLGLARGVAQKKEWGERMALMWFFFFFFNHLYYLGTGPRPRPVVDLLQ